MKMLGTEVPSDNSAAGPELRLENSTLRLELRQLHGHRDRRQKYDRWRDRLFANRHLSPMDKLVAHSLYPQARKQLSDGGNEPLAIFVGEVDGQGLAARIGASSDFYSRSLKRLAAAGAIKRRHKPRSRTGNTQLLIEFLPAFFERPDSLTPALPRNHGGARQKCPECGSGLLAVGAVSVASYPSLQGRRHASLPGTSTSVPVYQVATGDGSR
jgi:hypothetical protein